MTPVEIEVLLHYYYSPLDWEESGKVFSESVKSSLQHLQKLGLMIARQSTPNYILTEKGKVYVEQGLCCVPLPIQVWAFPTTGQ